MNFPTVSGRNKYGETALMKTIQATRESMDDFEYFFIITDDTLVIIGLQKLNETKYSRMRQANLWKTVFKNFEGIWSLPSNFLKDVLHKLYLVNSWTFCPKYFSDSLDIFKNYSPSDSYTGFLQKSAAN